MSTRVRASWWGGVQGHDLARIARRLGEQDEAAVDVLDAQRRPGLVVTV